MGNNHIMKRRQNTLAVFLGIAAALMIAEITTRISGKYYTYAELRFNMYTSFYEPGVQSWFFTNPPSTRITTSSNSEYSHTTSINSLGFSGGEFSKEKPNGIRRIISLGDSFTFGFGAPADSSSSRQLEDLLNSQSPMYEVFNCGVGGSDLIYSWILLKEKLLDYNPDIVLLSINSTDISDLKTRGGFERFQPDGTVQYLPAPWFEPLYKRSHLMRMVIHDLLKYDFMLQSRATAEKNTVKSIDALIACTDSIQELCAGKTIPVFIFHPVPGEITSGQFHCRKIFEHCIQHNYQTLNLFEYYARQRVNEKNVFDYYWKHDLHHNSSGYRLFAKGVSEKIKSLEDNF